MTRLFLKVGGIVCGTLLTMTSQEIRCAEDEVKQAAEYVKSLKQMEVERGLNACYPQLGTVSSLVELIAGYLPACAWTDSDFPFHEIKSPTALYKCRGAIGISPDSQFIVLWCSDEMYIINLDGSIRKIINTEKHAYPIQVEIDLKNQRFIGLKGLQMDGGDIHVVDFNGDVERTSNYSRDLNWFAIMDEDGSMAAASEHGVYVWGSDEVEKRIFTGNVRKVTMSKDRRFIVILAYNAKDFSMAIHVYDRERNRTDSFEVESDNSLVSALAVSPDNRFIAVGFPGGGILIYSIKGQRIDYECSDDPIKEIIIGRQFLIAVSPSNQVHLCDLRVKGQVRSFPEKASEESTGGFVALSPNEEFIIVVDKDREGIINAVRIVWADPHALVAQINTANRINEEVSKDGSFTPKQKNCIATYAQQIKDLVNQEQFDERRVVDLVKKIEQEYKSGLQIIQQQKSLKVRIKQSHEISKKASSTEYFPGTQKYLIDRYIKDMNLMLSHRIFDEGKSVDLMKKIEQAFESGSEIVRQRTLRAMRMIGE